jgi:hypothetical protein
LIYVVVMKVWMLVLALMGCYAEVRPGLSAPVGHGHGGVGFDVGFGGGVEHLNKSYSAGGGLMLGARESDTNGFVPFGVEGHVAVPLTPPLDLRGYGVLGVVHAGIATAVGLQKRSGSDENAPDGTVVQLFAGLGYGTTSPNLKTGHVAFGLSAARFWPDGGDAFWFLGGALELSYSFNQ